jgi:tyrosyl-tRNA synthetase
MQGYDSVHMNVDLEIGGSDQMFNMLVGRDLMKKLKNKEKFVLTTKLLVDSRGEKVGKTTGNALFLNSSAAEMYGGIMSFPDEVIPLSFELLTLLPLQSIKSLEKELSPIDLKKKLAFEIVKMYHSEKEAQKAQEEFEQVFQKRNLPQENILVHEIKPVEKEDVLKILTESGLVSSRSEAKRLIAQGGVDVDGATVKKFSEVKMKDGSIIKAGKRKFLKIKIKG